MSSNFRDESEKTHDKDQPGKDILVVNPGSTSTKMAIYANGNTEVPVDENVVHDEASILSFPTMADQLDYRKDVILGLLKVRGYGLERLSAVVGRGGMLYGLKGGGYSVDERMFREMASSDIPQHASNLGALIAYSIARPLGIPAFIYDSTMGAELIEIAKITGVSGLEKYGAVHLLNIRARAIDYAQTQGKNYKDMHLIICHMGGGITAGAMKNGKVIDVASYDDGPMAPERTGGIPLLLYNRLCFDGKHTQKDMDRLIAGKGGLYSYLGTKDCREVEKRIAEGDNYARTVYEAMAFQVAKSIAGLSCVFEGNVDAIILTGGIAHSKMLTGMIEKYCGHIAPVAVMAGEKEMEALANGALRMLTGKETAKIFADQQ